MFTDYVIFFFDKIVNIEKDERLMCLLEITEKESTIELMFRTRGAVEIRGNDLIELYKSLNNMDCTTKIAVDYDGIEKIDFYMPDNDFQKYLSAQEKSKLEDLM